MAPPPIYLDHQATTPTDPRVVAAMLPFFTEHFGNPASRYHPLGWRAEEAVAAARRQVARLVGAEDREIVFTSGATESNNLALQGVARAYRPRGDHLVTVATEHPSVREVARRLERDGWRVTFLPVAADGLLDPDQVAAVLTERTVLVSVMLANHEIGVLQPVAAIGAICKARGVLLHTDATQAMGKVPVDVAALGVDLLSLSGHKFYGPKGVGALYVRRRDPHVRLEPLCEGGGQERGLRPGTLAVPLIVGLGAAGELARAELPAEAARLGALRQRFWEGLRAELPAVAVNGHPTRRLPGNLNVRFSGVRSEALLTALQRVIAASPGSACASGHPGPSHVLRALGLPDDEAEASVRFGLGRCTTAEEVDAAVAALVAEVRKLRERSPAWALVQAGSA
jgi:cysteine desulfurase